MIERAASAALPGGTALVAEEGKTEAPIACLYAHRNDHDDDHDVDGGGDSDAESAAIAINCCPACD